MNLIVLFAVRISNCIAIPKESIEVDILDSKVDPNLSDNEVIQYFENKIAQERGAETSEIFINVTKNTFKSSLTESNPKITSLDKSKDSANTPESNSASQLDSKDEIKKDEIEKDEIKKDEVTKEDSKPAEITKDDSKSTAITKYDSKSTESAKYESKSEIKKEDSKLFENKTGESKSETKKEEAGGSLSNESADNNATNESLADGSLEISKANNKSSLTEGILDIFNKGKVKYEDYIYIPTDIKIFSVLVKNLSLVSCEKNNPVIKGVSIYRDSSTSKYVDFWNRLEFNKADGKFIDKTGCFEGVEKRDVANILATSKMSKIGFCIDNVVYRKYEQDNVKAAKKLIIDISNHKNMKPEQILKEKSDLGLVEELVSRYYYPIKGEDMIDICVCTDSSCKSPCEEIRKIERKSLRPL